MNNYLENICLFSLLFGQDLSKPNLVALLPCTAVLYLFFFLFLLQIPKLNYPPHCRVDLCSDLLPQYYYSLGPSEMLGSRQGKYCCLLLVITHNCS